MMSINAGEGRRDRRGVRFHRSERAANMATRCRHRAFLSNNNGGVLGGISTGQDLTVSIALKPTSSIRLPRKTIDVHGKETMVETTGRHDPCVGIRATPIAEAMLACVLMDHALRPSRPVRGPSRRPSPSVSGSPRKLEKPKKIN
jgi:chorismate synthase